MKTVKIKMKLNMMDRPYFLIFVATAVTAVTWVTINDGGYPPYYEVSPIWLRTLGASSIIGVAIGLSIWLIHRVIQKRGSVALLGSRIGWYLGGYGVYPFVFFSVLYLGFTIGVGLFLGIRLYISTLSATLEDAFTFGEIVSRVLDFLSFFVWLTTIISIGTIIPCLLVASLGYLLGGLMQRLVQRLAGQWAVQTDWREERQKSGRRDWESLCPILAFLYTILVVLLVKLWNMWTGGEFEGL